MMYNTVKPDQLPEPYTILVSGATGFIGSALIKHFENNKIRTVAISRKSIPETQYTKYIRADAFEKKDLLHAMQGISTAYYLLHSMEGDKHTWQDFVKREKLQARNFLDAAVSCGVKRIIYLGGLVNDSLELSPHMKSRASVGHILASSKIPVTELRASIIIGAQGSSYAMLRYLVERLQLMVCPSWVYSMTQPIALHDVLRYLVSCLYHKDTVGKKFEIGGPEKMTYKKLMEVYSEYLGKKLYILQLPFLTTRLSSFWVDLITPVRASIARPLIDSLVHDSIVNDHTITKVMPMKLMPVHDAIDAATIDLRENPPTPKPKEEKTGFKINQRIIQICLVLLGICGATYYILDDRNEMYAAYWLAASAVWYVGIVFAIIFIRSKTRLGYLIAGVLSWITMAFWLLDNSYLVLQSNIIAGTPSSTMTVRNFAGIAVAAVAIVSSHNLFHKVIDHHYKEVVK